MQLFSIDIPLANMAVLALLFSALCYQSAVYLTLKGSHWRFWRLLFWGMLMLHNLFVVLLPNEDFSIGISLQYILRYGMAFALGSCLPLYFYKAHGLLEFALHLRVGVPLCYGLSYLIFFCLVLPLGGSLELVMSWGMLLPCLYTLVLFAVLGMAVYRKLAAGELVHLSPLPQELVLSCISVMPWILLVFFVYVEVEPWVELCSTNVGFLLSWLLTIFRDFRHKLIERRLSRHLTVERQLSFQDRCLKYALSKREIEVAELLCAGLTYREIGEQLYISLHTVDNHVRHIFSKTGVNRKFELLGKLRPEGSV